MAKVKLDSTKAHQIYRLADGTRVPGGSTIAKVAGAYWSTSTLIAWANREGLEGRDCGKVRDAAADAGTLAHWLIECHLAGNTPDLSEFAPATVGAAENAYLHWLEWWESKGMVAVHVEKQIVSETYRFGGTLDVIARAPDGRLWLLDWKSGKAIYSEAWIQVAGYWLAWEDQSGAEKLSGVIIGRIGKEASDGDSEFIERTNLDAHKRWFLAGLALYEAQKACK